VESLRDRVCIVTGAGRGIGRDHALFFASEGAKLVVNDLGGAADGSGADQSPAQQVVDEIVAAGGEAVANFDDVSTWVGADALVRQAIDAFGDLHVVVNNAGILRDRTIANMSETEWDAVINVHLKGHAATTHFAGAYWRDEHKAGREVSRAIVNTSSTSGLFGSIGQANYGAAKSAIASLTQISNAELRRYGVRVNAIAPAAATRLMGREVPPPAEGEWNPLDPANVSPFVAYLSTVGCPINGRIFFVMGGEVQLFHPWAIVESIHKDGKWTVDELEKESTVLQERQFEYGSPMGGRIDG
jgi:NAD(P)-dependent dehydrogenase (short-subunit alcohol dehydrogenase family)